MEKEIKDKMVDRITGAGESGRMITISKITDAYELVRKYKGVIFDLDDTLYGEKAYVKSGYRKIAAALPQVADADGKLWRAFENKESAIDSVLHSEGIYTDELKDKCLGIYRNQEPDIDFYPGVADMLLKLKAGGCRLGLITDGRPIAQRAKIKALGLEEYFDEIIVTDELGGIEYRKPCSKAFILMKERLAIDYSDMVYIGDNLSKDFVAPGELGMGAVHFANMDGLYYGAR